MEKVNDTYKEEETLSPSNLKLNPYDDDSATPFEPADSAPVEVVETGNIYEDIALDKEDNIVEEQEYVETEKPIQYEQHSEPSQVTQQSLPKNWPWFYPVLYHNIEKDIPQEFRVFTRNMFRLCLATWLTIFWNWIVILVSFFGGYGAGIMDFFWSTIYGFLGCPLAWKTWYKSLYISLKGNGSSFRWMLFMITYIIHIGFVSISALGIPNFASTGLLFMLKAFDNNTVVGIFALIGFFFWSVLSFFSVSLFKRSWHLFRSSDVESEIKKDLVKSMIK